MRGLRLPGTEELQKAAMALLGGGYNKGLQAIQQQLVIYVLFKPSAARLARHALVARPSLVAKGLTP